MASNLNRDALAFRAFRLTVQRKVETHAAQMLNRRTVSLPSLSMMNDEDLTLLLAALDKRREHATP